MPWQQLLPKNAEFQAVLQEKNCSTKQHQNGHGLTRMCAVIFTRKLGNLECSTLKFEMSKGTNPKSDLYKSVMNHGKAARKPCSW